MIMKHQKIINMLDNTSIKPSKFRTRNCVEVNDDLRGTCNTDSQIKSKTLMLKSSSDAHILVGAGATDAAIQEDKNK